MDKSRRPAALMVLAVLAVLVVFLGARMVSRYRPTQADDLAPGEVDDISRLNRTRVAEVWPIPQDPVRAEDQLRQVLARARAQRLPVAIAGARHSMGGHTIAPDGIVINMLPFSHMTLAADRKLLHVGAGARWAEVLPFLDAAGLSLAGIQSNHDFSVGGSVSVNCHGLDAERPPLAAAVDSFRLMKASGDIVRCSRSENVELFKLALGGYGLFGVILDVDLKVVANERYRLETVDFAAAEAGKVFAENVGRHADVGMLYGRLCVAPGDSTFLREGMFMIFRRSPCAPELLPALKTPGFFRQFWDHQVARGLKEPTSVAYWAAEKQAAAAFAGQHYSRNQLLNEPATAFQRQARDRTFILQEYFVPPDRFAAFLDRLRAIVPRHQGTLLSAVVRRVSPDEDTFLRYATEDMFTLAMMFEQPRTAAGDEDMQRLTRDMIDAALDCQGRFYLPYRLHASRAQIDRAYPQFADWLKQKRQHDPDELFQNQFYLRYRSP